MRWIFAALAAMGFALASFEAQAEVDWTKVDSALGRNGGVIAGVHKYGLPRTDLHVSLDGVDVLPGLALGGWIAFAPMGDSSMMMGDLVLTENEVNPVMSALVSNGVQVTGVHNHLLRASPPTLYMHVAGRGDPAQLAEVVRAALERSKTPMQATPATAGAAPKLDIDTAKIDEILGFKGVSNSGVYQFSIPRADVIRVADVAIPPAMGTAIALNFEPTGEGRAAAAGDFVALANELGPLLKALRLNGVEVTAVHNHMLDEEPRAFFVHFWANGDAVKLAHGLREGLDALHVAARS